MEFLFGFIIGIGAGLLIGVVAVATMIISDHKREINNPQNNYLWHLIVQNIKKK